MAWSNIILMLMNKNVEVFRATEGKCVTINKVYEKCELYFTGIHLYISLCNTK